MAEPSPSRLLRRSAVLEDALVRELLGLRLIAVLAMFDEGGGIHAVPMWFASMDDAIVLATGSRSRKVRNLERDPRATVVFHDSRPGFEVCGASLRGEIEIVTGDAATPLVALVHERYVDPVAGRTAGADEFLASDDVAFRFRPAAALTWDERASDATRALRDSGAAYALEPTSPR